jgi:hypothetical protein
MWDLSLILIRKSAVREDQNKTCCEVLLDVEGGTFTKAER